MATINNYNIYGIIIFPQIILENSPFMSLEFCICQMLVCIILLSDCPGWCHVVAVLRSRTCQEVLGCCCYYWVIVLSNKLQISTTNKTPESINMLSCSFGWQISFYWCLLELSATGMSTVGCRLSACQLPDPVFGSKPHLKSLLSVVSSASAIINRDDYFVDQRINSFN